MNKRLVLLTVLIVVIAALAVNVFAQNNEDDVLECENIANIQSADIVSLSNSRIRQSGINNAKILTVVPVGGVVSAIAIDADALWVKVCYADVEGWTLASLWKPVSRSAYAKLPIEDTDLLPARTEPDSDGDGLQDNKDFCPKDAGDILRARPYTGCPQFVRTEPDSDGDGLQDNKDYCPKDAGDILRARPYAGCPHPSLLDQCVKTAVQGVCLELASGYTEPIVVTGPGGSNVLMYCPTYLDPLGNPTKSTCLFPAVSKVFVGNVETFLVRGEGADGLTLLGYPVDTSYFTLAAGDPQFLPTRR